MHKCSHSFYFLFYFCYQIIINLLNVAVLDLAMAVVQLRDTALFTVAADLFSREVPTIRVIDCWTNLTEDVSKLVPLIYPKLPRLIESNILKTISLIGKPLFLFLPHVCYYLNTLFGF